MNSRAHSLFPVIVLTLLAGVSIWLDRATQQSPMAKVDKTRHEPDFTADKITLRRFDLTGKIQYVLVADSMVTWTEAYKIDGFRMDLMEHLMKSSVEKAMAAVKAVRPDSWIYGEGWNFGEV